MKRIRKIKELNWEELQDKAPTKAVLESLSTTKSKLDRYDNILCSVSGGSDSDVLLDLCERLSQVSKDDNGNTVGLSGVKELMEMETELLAKVTNQ